MFSNLNKPAFGSSTTTQSFGFGNTAAPNQTPFGQSQLFGQPATSGFGTTTPLFGANTQQPAPPLFGTPTNTFGAAPQQPGFGTTGLFGQQQNVATGNTLFGSPSTTFGQQNKPAAFGFGSTPTPLFGQQQTQPFQPSTSSGMFGASNAFGASGQMGTVVKFNPVTGTDTMAKSGLTHSISTKHHCITCMKEYDTKSLEELRWEDYQCNRKGPQQQQGGFGSFGTPASTAPSLFGGTGTENKTAFGQMNTFAPSSSAFGLTSQANQSSIFGQPATGFGTQTTTSFGFDSSNTGFGNTATVKPFGATPAQNVFSTPTTQTTGFGTSLFGQPNVQTSTAGFFNKPAQPVFSTQQPMFSLGQPTATTQSSFFQQATKPSTGFGTFGQTNLNTTTGFGQQTGLFSQPAQNPFNSFAKPAPPAFGTQQPLSFGIGTQQPAGTSLFANTNKPLFPNAPQSNFFSGSSTGFMMPQQQQMGGLNTNSDSQLDFHTVVQKIYEPFPRYSFLDELDISKPSCHNTTNPTVLKEIIDNPPVAVSPTNDIAKFRILHNSKTTPKNHKFSMLEGIHDTTTNNWNGKRLNLSKVSEKSNKQTKDYSFGADLDKSTANVPNRSWFSPNNTNVSNTSLSPDIGIRKSSSKPYELNIFKKKVQEVEAPANLYPSLLSFGGDGDSQTSPFRTQIMDKSPTTKITTPKESNEEDEESQILKEVSSPKAVRFDDELEVTSTVDVTDAEDPPIDTCGIKLERVEYYTLPPLNEIKKYENESGACIIKGFTIGRVGYGNVYFPDPIDVSNLNLDEIIHIRYREVIVYTDDNNKPPVGEGLNRPAQVTIDRVWPRDPETKSMIKDASEIMKNNFVERLAAVSEKQNAKFVDYRPDTGSWVFTVEHFSKYKYIDDVDEDGSGDADKSLQHLETKKPEEANEPVAMELVEDMETNSPEPVKRGLGGFYQPEQHPDDSASFIRSFSMPHRVPQSKSVVIMKSTFFDEESVSDDVTSSELAAQHFGMQATMQDLTLVQPRKPQIEKPKQYVLHSFAQIVPIHRSLSLKPNYMDMQAFRGRSYKVGWGRGFTLMALPGANGITDLGEGVISSNTLICLEMECLTTDVAMGDLENHMLEILDCSTVNVDKDGIPLCTIKEGSNCLERLKESTNANNVCYKDVWDLCLAFWGPCATSSNEHNELFDEWLENVTAPFVKDELEQSSHVKSTILKNIFKHLTGRQIEEASNLAMDSGLPRLAISIPSSLNNTSRTLLYNQVHSWKESGAINHMEKELIKIYMLLAGIPISGDINVFESLDWKRSLAIHFWYMCSPGILLTASLQAYNEAFSSTGYACRPSPEYYRSTDGTTNDVLYNIIHLFATQRWPLYNVLNPASYTDNPLDFSLSWFLLQVFLALKVGTISEHVHDNICISFSSQLEHLDLWKWAVFVLLFIKNKSVKYNTIMGILDRNLEITRNTKNMAVEDFLVNKCKISPLWIHSVLAHKTALFSNHLEAFQHLTLANDYGKAHTTAVHHLIPKFIKTCQLDLLTKLLKDLLPGRATIWQWTTQAGFILDFLEIYHKITNFKDDLSDFDCRNIKSALNSLCIRMKEFPLETPHQSKALSKIGQFISELVAIVYCELDSGAKNKEIASDLIKTLVMPYDYIYNELEKLSNKECAAV